MDRFVIDLDMSRFFCSQTSQMRHFLSVGFTSPVHKSSESTLSTTGTVCKIYSPSRKSMMKGTITSILQQVFRELPADKICRLGQPRQEFWAVAIASPIGTLFGAQRTTWPSATVMVCNWTLVWPLRLLTFVHSTLDTGILRNTWLIWG